MKSSQFPHPPGRVRGQPGSFLYEKCLLTEILESLIHFILLLILFLSKLSSCLLTYTEIYTNKPNDRHLFQLGPLLPSPLSLPTGHWSTQERPTACATTTATSSRLLSGKHPLIPSFTSSR